MPPALGKKHSCQTGLELSAKYVRRSPSGWLFSGLFVWRPSDLFEVVGQAPDGVHGADAANRNGEHRPPGGAIDLVHGGTGLGQGEEALQAREQSEDDKNGDTGWDHFEASFFLVFITRERSTVSKEGCRAQA